MPCPNGTERRPGSPPNFVIRSGEVAEVFGRDAKISFAAPYDIVGAYLTDDFCRRPASASHEFPRFPGDPATAAVNRVIDQRWRDYCRCKPAKDPRLDVIGGGRCPTIYDWVATLDYQNFQTFSPETGSANGGITGPFTVAVAIETDGVGIEYLRLVVASARDGSASYFAAPAKIGSSRVRMSIRRRDGLSDNCGEQVTNPIELPPDFVGGPPMPVPDISPPPCNCPPKGNPGVLLVPFPVPQFVPAPIPAPILIPIPIPVPFPVPVPAPVPTPPSIPPPRKPEDSDMNCCAEILAAIAALQEDVNTVKDDLLPDLKQYTGDRLDGLIECLDFSQYTYDSTSPLGTGETGVADISDRCLAVRLSASSPAPANKSKRQDGGNTPDVIQGGWVWFEYRGGVSERLPIDAEQKVLPVPQALFKKEGVRVYWRGVNAITYNVTQLLVKQKSIPPYEDRPCQP